MSEEQKNLSKEQAAESKQLDAVTDFAEEEEFDASKAQAVRHERHDAHAGEDDGTRCGPCRTHRSRRTGRSGFCPARRMNLHAHPRRV